MRTRISMVVALVVILTMACNLTPTPAGTPTNQAGGESPTVQAGGEIPTEQGPGANSPNPVPVNLNDGLASLNSYEMTVVISSFGPDPKQTNMTRIHRQRSNDANASFTSIDMNATSPDGEDPTNSNTTIYQISYDQCSGNDTDGWSWSSSTPAEAEMQGLMTSMFGLTPLIDTPVFVAAETVNGIPTNHFTFQVSGLGATSGALVNINQGEYWLAIDGQYIVNYSLIVETSTAPDTNVVHEEFSIKMDQINQPVDIAFPQGCLDASLVTPTP